MCRRVQRLDATRPGRYRSAMRWRREDVIAFRDRPWDELERAPVPRDASTSERLAGSLYEQVREANLEWPSATDRDDDLAAHIRLVQLFARAHDAERGRSSSR